ncbi:UNVERIFIED_ORG: hypothetical protein J2W66_004419 [Agrobacterium larrymoorei]|nr:hypothetical protein [Agrobacterium larrymoorei]
MIDGFREQIPLPEPATKRQELVKLSVGLDAFCHNPQAQLRGDAEQSLNDYHGTMAWNQPLDEGFVDLDDLDRDRQKMCKRREPRSKVVKRDTHSAVAEGLDLFGDHMIALAEIHGLRHLENNVLQRDAGIRKDRTEPLLQMSCIKVRRGKIDADVLEGQPAVEPGAHVPCDTQEHAFCQLGSNMGVFGRFVKVGSSYYFPRRGCHAAQCLESHHLARIKPYDRLIMSMYPVFGQREADITYSSKPPR